MTTGARPRPAGPVVLVVEDDGADAALPAHDARGARLPADRGRDRRGRRRGWRRSTFPTSCCSTSASPTSDGLEVARRIREWSTMPIIVLSARDQERQKVEALDAGADDYLTKPFGLAELLAASGSRSGTPGSARPARWTSPSNPGPLRVDLAARRVLVDGTRGPPHAGRVQAARDARPPRGPRRHPQPAPAGGLGTAERGPDPLPARLHDAPAAQARAGSSEAAPLRDRGGRRDIDSCRRSRGLAPGRLPPSAARLRSSRPRASRAACSAAAASLRWLKSTQSSSWSWLKQEKTKRLLAGDRIDVPLEALRADLLHHALHRRVDAADRDVVGREERLERRGSWRAFFTAAIMRSEPIAMMRRTPRERDRAARRARPARRRSSPGRCCRGSGGPAAGAARSRRPRRSSR